MGAICLNYMQSLIDGSLSVKGEASVYLGGDFTGYNIENLLAKPNKETI